jgi:hypothetical protein
MAANARTRPRLPIYLCGPTVTDETDLPTPGRDTGEALATGLKSPG